MDTFLHNCRRRQSLRPPRGLIGKTDVTGSALADAQSHLADGGIRVRGGVPLPLPSELRPTVKSLAMIARSVLC